MADLVVTDITKEFATRSDPLVVLRGVSVQLQQGANAAIIGPSGSGKSTLLHILGTLERPTSGSVQLGGTDPFSLDEPRLADFRNKQIGFIFQDHHLLPQCTVVENVLVPALARGGVANETIERAHSLIDRVGLGERRQHRPSELSGGERQRVAVARALICRPALLLADEPTGNLDRTTAGVIAQLLLEMQRQENTMMVVVTHSLELAGKMDQRMELDEGRLRSL